MSDRDIAHIIGVYPDTGSSACLFQRALFVEVSRMSGLLLDITVGAQCSGSVRPDACRDSISSARPGQQRTPPVDQGSHFEGCLDPEAKW